MAAVQDVFNATTELPDGEGGSGGAVSTFTENVLQTIYIVIGVIGFSGNLFVFSVLMSSKTLRQKITNIYLINQAVVDGLACTLIVIFALTASDGTEDDLLCRLWLTRFPIWSVVQNSTYGLLALTADRYFRIVHPVAYKNHFTKKKMAVILVSVWLWGPIYNFSWNWPTSGVVDGSCLIFAVWPSAPVSSFVGVLTVVLQYFLPLGILTFCYIKMVLVIRGRIKPSIADASGDGGKHQAAAGGGPKAGFEKAKDNIIKTLIFVGLCFVLCWTWNEIFILLFFLGYPSDFGSSFYHFTVVAVFSNSCINPFIYCAKYEDFQVYVRKVFCKNRVNNMEDTAQTTAGHTTGGK